MNKTRRQLLKGPIGLAGALPMAVAGLGRGKPPLEDIKAVKGSRDCGFCNAINVAPSTVGGVQPRVGMLLTHQLDPKMNGIYTTGR